VAQPTELDDQRLEMLDRAIGMFGAHAASPHDRGRSNGCTLPVREAPRAPRIRVVVIAVAFPEPGTIVRDQLDRTNPLRALPEIAPRHDKAQGPSVLGREIHAVVLV